MRSARRKLVEELKEKRETEPELNHFIIYNTGGQHFFVFFCLGRERFLNKNQKTKNTEKKYKKA